MNNHNNNEVFKSHPKNYATDILKSFLKGFLFGSTGKTTKKEIMLNGDISKQALTKT